MIKKGDFVEIDFVGKIADSNEIFDLTREDVAKEKNIYNPNLSYKPLVICVGEGDILNSLDEKLIGKKEGKFEIGIKSEEGFGRKNPALLKLVPIKIFKKENLRPFPGLNVNIDGYVGTVRSVSGGRVIVDFNHPLSGKDLVFDIEVKKIINDVKDKAESIVSKINNKYELKIDKKVLNLKIKIDDKHKEILKEKILKLIPEIKEIKFEEEKETKINSKADKKVDLQ